MSFLVLWVSKNGFINIDETVSLDLNMTSSFCGKPPNFPWRGSVSQWEQEKSDQIRVGESIFPGYLWSNNYLRGNLFETAEDKKRYQKWKEAQKNKGKPDKPKKPGKKSLEYIDESKLGLADFM